MPIVVMTGGPRSGTTLVGQVLARHLRVACVNNLMAVFPRSPIVATRVLARLVGPPLERYDSFYGRTQGLGAPSGAHRLWDRWLGPKAAMARVLDPDTEHAMASFLGAYEAVCRRPVLVKSNRAGLWAALVARALPTACFVVVRRDPRFVAQSMLRARHAIQGSPEIAHGPIDPARRSSNAAADVCAQLAHLLGTLDERCRALDGGRLWSIAYEDCCRAPHSVVARLAREILGIATDEAALRAAILDFTITNGLTCPPAEFAELAEHVDPALPGAPA